MSPRWVRPAWLEAEASNRETGVSMGPRVEGGWINAYLTLRTPDGDVSPAIRIVAGGSRGLARINIPASFEVKLETLGDGSLGIDVGHKP
jgi:hypothetical protein